MGSSLSCLSCSYVCLICTLCDVNTNKVNEGCCRLVNMSRICTRPAATFCASQGADLIVGSGGELCLDPRRHDEERHDAQDEQRHLPTIVEACHSATVTSQTDAGTSRWHCTFDSVQECGAGQGERGRAWYGSGQSIANRCAAPKVNAAMQVTRFCAMIPIWSPTAPRRQAASVERRPATAPLACSSTSNQPISCEPARFIGQRRRSAQTGSADVH